MEKISAFFGMLFLYLIQYGVLLFPLYFLIKYLKKKIHEAKEEKKRQYILENSVLLEELKSINSKYSFYDIKPTYSYTFDCKTKAEYDSFDFYEKFCNICFRNSKELHSIMSQADDNSRKRLVYLKEYIDLTKQFDNKGLGEAYREEEKKIIQENRLNTIGAPRIVIIKKYTSPKGMNHYHASKEYPLYEIEKAIKEKRDYYKANAERKARVEYERSLMTPRLRYKVMQRDGFKCVICGASSKDGVTLHVDHIKPVSKGGKTEMNNLRTLCDRCNLGKGALYIEDGVN